MRLPFALLSVLALASAGCLAPPLPGLAGDARDAAVVAEDFDRAGSPWVVQVASGCGLCGGQSGFRPHAEHWALFVFEGGRLLLVEHNGGPWGEGDAIHLYDNLSYDGDELRALLRESPRAEAGEQWVVRTTTGRLDRERAEELASLWEAGAPDTMCTDSGIAYALRHANGTVERASFTCGPSAGPMQELARRLWDVREALQARGHLEGLPPA